MIENLKNVVVDQKLLIHILIHNIHVVDLFYAGDHHHSVKSTSAQMFNIYKILIHGFYSGTWRVHTTRKIFKTKKPKIKILVPKLKLIVSNEYTFSTFRILLFIDKKILFESKIVARSKEC